MPPIFYYQSYINYRDILPIWWTMQQPISETVTIDLVKVINDNYPKLNNSNSMKRKNIQRKQIRAKKRATTRAFEDAIRNMVLNDL